MSPRLRDFTEFTEAEGRDDTHHYLSSQLLMLDGQGSRWLPHSFKFITQATLLPRSCAPGRRTPSGATALVIADPATAAPHSTEPPSTIDMSGSYKYRGALFTS